MFLFFWQEHHDAWAREKYMRNFALETLLDSLGSEDLVLYGDLDEIPALSVVQRLKSDVSQIFPVVLRIPLYKMTFGCLDRDFAGEAQWQGPVGELHEVLTREKLWISCKGSNDRAL